MTAPTTREALETRFCALLAKARANGREQIHIGVTAGNFVVMVARPNGSGGSAAARCHAESIIYAGRIRHELDNVLADQRGPASDRQINGEIR